MRLNPFSSCLVFLALFLPFDGAPGNYKTPARPTATTQPATSQPVATSQPSRHLEEIGWEIGRQWEGIAEIINEPNWEMERVTRRLTKLRELQTEHDSRMAGIQQALANKMANQADKTGELCQGLASILTPDQTEKFLGWIREAPPANKE